jgi:hypothetical protein
LTGFGRDASGSERRGRRKAEVVEDADDDFSVGDEGEHVTRSAAVAAGQYVDGEGAA